MGSGKSTVGKALARRLGYPFLDADREIETRCGVDIPTIFEFEGEAGFRAREKKIISELAAIDPVIMATGGGAILNRSNRKTLRDNGYVIMLSVEIEEQLRRVSLNKNRPLLQGDDVEKKLRVLMDERRAIYESTAHHIVSTNSSRMQNVVAKIARHLVREKIVPELPSTAGSKTNKGDSQNSKKRAKSQSTKSSRTRTSKHTSGKAAATNRDKSQKTTKATPKTSKNTLDANDANDAKSIEQNKASGTNKSSGKTGKNPEKNPSAVSREVQRNTARNDNKKQGESRTTKRSGTGSRHRRVTDLKKQSSDKGTSK